MGRTKTEGAKLTGVSWNYYDKEEFRRIEKKYLPVSGEGETIATQIVTATTKLVYKWYNDGDVFDNTHHIRGWCNDLSSYANWLYNHAPIDGVREILDRIEDIDTDDEYEVLLKDLVDLTNDEAFLEGCDKLDKVGSIYNEGGKFEFTTDSDEEEDEYEWDDEEDEDDLDEEEDEC